MNIYILVTILMLTFGVAVTLVLYFDHFIPSQTKAPYLTAIAMTCLICSTWLLSKLKK